MKPILISLLILFSLLSHSELRQYKEFDTLTDDESQDISIVEEEQGNVLKSPVQDYLELTPSLQSALDECKQAKAFLVFNQDPQQFISSCKKAFELGAVDAGYILGNELMVGEWMAVDLVESVLILEESARNGSRLAKRALITYYTNPLTPFSDKQAAVSLAKELSATDDIWDDYKAASIKAAYGSVDEAREGFKELIELANEGYKGATVSAALAKIKKGPMHDLLGAKRLFEKAEVYADRSYSFLPVILDVVEGNLPAARLKLDKCENLNSVCNNLYFGFLTKGIGGPKDLWKANDIIERAYQRAPHYYANNYAWHKATYAEAPIYDPKAALEAIEHIPEYKRPLPYIQDTLAAVYAANGWFADAYTIQKTLLDQTAGKGLEKRFRRGDERMKAYASKRRWVAPLEVDYFLDGVTGFESIDNVQLEVSSL